MLNLPYSCFHWFEYNKIGRLYPLNALNIYEKKNKIADLIFLFTKDCKPFDMLLKSNSIKDGLALNISFMMC